MSRLSDWVEENTTITQEKYDENDISTNERIRSIFFNQIEDLSFNVESADFDKGYYIISLRLDFPRKTETPYTFLFEAGKKAIVPQYTITHRVYHARDSEEDTILQNLEFYLEQNPENKVKFNPKYQRDRSTDFLYKTGSVLGDVVSFEFDDKSIWEKADGTFVIKYLKYSKPEDDDLIAYQHGSQDFTTTSKYKNIRITRKLVDDKLCFYVYNIPVDLDFSRISMEARY